LYYDKCPYFLAYIISILFLPFVFYKFIIADEDKKDIYAYALDSYLLTYGFYVMCRIWIEQIKPESIVISNDLIFTNRVILLVAKELGIVTFYIQHAAVNSNFPPLTVDYALLDGRDAVDKYYECGPTSAIIYIIGISKFDSLYNKINNLKVLARLGICTNNLDSIERIEELCITMRSTFPSLIIYLRTHPADRRTDNLKKLASRLGINYSDSKNELSYDFLQSVDVVIGCNSNILLEAAMMDVHPLYFDFSRTNLDWYGFVKSGLVEYYSDSKPLCGRLLELQKSKPSIRSKARFYSGTVGTRYDGRSSDLASSIIKEITAGHTINMNLWDKIPNDKLKAYELRVNDAAQ